MKTNSSSTAATVGGDGKQSPAATVSGDGKQSSAGTVGGDEKPSQAAVYQIGGVPVEFPYKPYGTQLAFMGRVISTLERAHKQGRCHALLESPTGTGKSLSLLCSSLAWLRHHLLRPPEPSTSAVDPLLHGGGFVPEADPHGNTEQSPAAQRNAKVQRKLKTPTIYYASRTHSQITQVIREYRKTSYRVPMALLASRKHYCINEHVCTKSNVDEECKLLLEDKIVGCLEFKNSHKVKSHHSLQKGGCNEVHDIEDLVKVGRTVKGCPYFAAQTMAAEAQLIFCPYSYITSPIVRRAMDIDITGSIVILDEAHNIEDMAREAGSMDLEEDNLHKLQTELAQLCLDVSVTMTYQPLYDMIQGLTSWMDDRKSDLQKRDFEKYSSFWTGEAALRELQQAGISQQYFPILKECATKAIKAATNDESEGAHLSGMSSITLEGLVSSLTYLFSGSGIHASDYQLALQRYVKRDGSSLVTGWTHSLSLWCLNPAVVFREIADLSLSVILTSGTLSPVGSFASELGVHFETCMEAQHVINVEKQLWAGVISSGPGDSPLNASYKTADSYSFQDALGASLEEICKIVPAGALVFFPSYKLMEKLRIRWCQTGQWDRLNAQKPLFVEPRGSMEELEPILKSYYDTVHGNVKRGLRRPKGRKKGDYEHSKKPMQVSVNKGAVFLAVCRGKVSEGIDFSDENARVVVIVGIPFPNINEIQVVLKKKYNDTYRSSKGLLSGSEWYCYQAFRALNQAAGRCIRHKSDYGAIILLDERFKEERNLAYISKWLKKSIKKYDNFEESLEGLRTFFASHLNKGMADVKTPLSNWAGSPRTTKNIAYENGIEMTSSGYDYYKDNDVVMTEHSHLVKERMNNKWDNGSQPHTGGQCKAQKSKVHRLSKKPLNRQIHYVDLESDATEYSGNSGMSTLSKGSVCHPVINEAPENGLESSGRLDIYNDQHTYSAGDQYQMINRYRSIGGVPLISHSSANSSYKPSEVVYTGTVTPERECQRIGYPECESSFSFSVNSHQLKRRKIMASQLNGCNQMGRLSSPGTESVSHADSKSIQQPCHDNQLTASILANNRSSCLLPSQNLNISCKICKSPVGACEKGSSLTCSLTSTLKFHLADAVKIEPDNALLLEFLSKTQQPNVPTVISDILSISHLFLQNRSKEYPQDIWSEEDGIVFRVICCPFCTPKTYLGLRIMAVDASNIHLLNKIVFYSDQLDIQKEAESTGEIILPCSKTIKNEDHSPFTTEKLAEIPQSNTSAALSSTKSKLKLPRHTPDAFKA